MTKQSVTKRLYRYEVDLAMLPAGATTADLRRLCTVLQRIMDEDGTDLAQVVACESARNSAASQHQLAWGWPTKENWLEAVREVFTEAPRPPTGGEA